MNNWLNAKVIATIPIFIAVNLAAIAIWLLDISAQSMPLILGIIAGGLVDLDNRLTGLSLIHISEPTRQRCVSRMPSSA